MHLGRQGFIQCGHMDPVAGTTSQPFAPDQQRYGARLLHKACGQRHRVGRFAEKRCPHAHAFWRDLIGQQTHRFTAPQRAQHLAYTGQRGGCGYYPRTFPRVVHQAAHPCLACRPVQHRDRTERVRKTFRIRLRRHFEAAHVGRQQQHSATLRVSVSDQVRTLPIQAGADRLTRLAQPQKRELHQQPAGVSDARARGAFDARQAGVFVETTAVRRRQPERQPA